MKRLIAEVDVYEMSFTIEHAFDSIAFQKDNVNNITDTLSDFIKNIDASAIESMVSKDVGESIKFNQIVDFIESNTMCKNDLTKMYDRFKSKYKETENDGLLNVSEVKQLNDSVGETTKFNGHIDFDNRDKCFVYIHPNQLLVSNEGESHTQLLQDWCDKNNISFNSTKSEERLTKQELKDIDINKCSFGHIVDSIAFIDSLQNVSIDEVTKSLIKNGFSKVYNYNDRAHTIKRLAYHPTPMGKPMGNY